jgi:hypothetical protein
MDSFADNEARADLAWRGKVVQFTAAYGGGLWDFRPFRSHDGRYCLDFPAPPFGHPRITVRVCFDPASVSRLADPPTLTRTDALAVAIRGRCQGRTNDILTVDGAELVAFGLFDTGDHLRRPGAVRWLLPSPEKGR